MRILSLLTAVITLTGCSQADMLNVTIPTRGFTSDTSISYGPHERHLLDVHLPKTRSKNPPVVLFIYGGSWQEGTKDDYLFMAQTLTELGAVAVIPDYRIYPEVKYPDFITDAARATEWIMKTLPEKYNINPKNVFVMGHSAGAFNAAALAYQPQFLAEFNLTPDIFKGVIGLAGPYAFEPNSDDLRSIFSTATPQEYHPQQHPKPNPPALLIWGAEDEVVVPRNSIKMAAALTEAGNKNVTTYEAPKRDHISIILSLAYRFRGMSEAHKYLTNFLQEHTDR